MHGIEKAMTVGIGNVYLKSSRQKGDNSTQLAMLQNFVSFSNRKDARLVISEKIDYPYI